jgi:hypothetical protein
MDFGKGNLFGLPRMPETVYLVRMNLKTGVRNVRNSPEFGYFCLPRNPDSGEFGYATHLAF